MEVSLFEAKGLPEGSVLSVRAGNTRRQAPIPLQGPLRFPSLPFNAKQFKLDIMRTLGSAKCEIKAAKELESYSVLIDMPDGDQARIGFSVREQPNLCGKRASELKQVDKNQDGADADPTMASAEKAWAGSDTRTYAREHNIPNFVQEMLQMVLREKPDAPFTVMAEYLQKKAIELGEITGGEITGYETTMRAPSQSQKQYSASIPQDIGERTLPARNMKSAPPPRGGTRPYQDEAFQNEEGMLQQKSAPPPTGGFKQQPSAYYQPQKGLPVTHEGSGASQQPQMLQSQPQAVAQRRHVSHQVPADGDKAQEEEFGLRATATKHKMKRMATSAIEDMEADDGDGDFYVPKLEREKEHDDNSSYGGGPDGYVPSVPAQGVASDQYDDGEVAGYAKAGKPRSAAEVARRARGGNQKSLPGRRGYDEDYGAAPQAPMKRDDGGDYKRGLKSVPPAQKAAYRSARVTDDPDRANLEAEHMALQAERAALLHDLARLNQKMRR